MAIIRSIMLLSCIILLSACGDTNEDGSLVYTYSSCKIISSDALFAKDRDNDLSHCWSADGDGYISKGDALQWCSKQVNNYLSENYLLGHSVKFMVESSYCH